MSDYVLLNASVSGSVLFSEPSAFVPSVKAYAGKGIVVNGSVSSVGSLVLEGAWSGEDVLNSTYAIDVVGGASSTSSYLSSVTGSVELEVDGQGRVRVGSPGVWSAGNGITLGGPVDVSGSGVFTLDSDSDLDGVGTLSLPVTSNVSVTSVSVTGLSVIAADMDVMCQVRTGSASVTLQSTNSSGMQVGSSVSGGFSVTDVELDRIETAGVLTLGGILT